VDAIYIYIYISYYNLCVFILSQMYVFEYYSIRIIKTQIIFSFITHGFNREFLLGILTIV